ncbi:DUF4097 family beta strand repeat-containing protein [Marinactinospora thermotolerans]|uniref:Putative adhesin n=1 Tax=Marinactinospora thermotolerans DSM 45154 TaxID=1122192 RepID=A0A1T4TAM7_9ACTN|nr:DUF4097 family beta strand repeat-containing protein [Marinactinospora thermotolerans]SKA37381.1 Putative adhesin [Marinactinospora thermotolerans DSM 45154]
MTFTGRGLYASSSKEPRGRRSGWLFIGAVVGVVALIVAAASVLSSFSTNHAERVDSFDGAARVVIQNRTNGDVEITGTSGDQVVVGREARESPVTEVAERVGMEGDEVRATANCDGWQMFGGCAVDYSVEVPEGVEVVVESETGDVEVEGVAANITVTAGTGEVELSGVEGDLDLRTTTGEISAEGRGEVVRATSTTGDIDLEDFTATTAEVRATTGNIDAPGGFTTLTVAATTGEVHVGTASPFERISVQTTTGDVMVQVPAGEYDVIGDSGTGDRDIHVRVDRNAEQVIDASTSTGSVTVETD